MARSPAELAPEYHQSVWGVASLAPWFLAPPGTGEVWFPVPGDFPLLVKFIFTSERLSVQVHPPDDYAQTRERCRGKTEMWHILEAREGAAIGLGLTRPVSKEDFRAAAQRGGVEALVNWLPVRPGETYLVPAGTVHAIGAGVKLCEIQENSNVTYRLYDYGRPRELHLEKGLEVARLEPYQGLRSLPLRCEHFHTEELVIERGAEYQPGPAAHLLIAIEGSGTAAGRPLRAGTVLFLEPGTNPFEILPSPRLRLLRTYSPR